MKKKFLFISVLLMSCGQEKHQEKIPEITDSSSEKSASMSQVKDKRCYDGIEGRWRSKEDTNSELIISDNLAIYKYEGESNDTMKAYFKKENLDNRSTCILELRDKDSAEYKYEIDYVSAKELTLVYLTRGNMLNYERVK